MQHTCVYFAFGEFTNRIEKRTSFIVAFKLKLLHNATNDNTSTARNLDVDKSCLPDFSNLSVSSGTLHLIANCDWRIIHMTQIHKHAAILSHCSSSVSDTHSSFTVYSGIHKAPKIQELHLKIVRKKKSKFRPTFFF